MSHVLALPKYVILPPEKDLAFRSDLIVQYLNDYKKESEDPLKCALSNCRSGEGRKKSLDWL